MIKYLAVVLLSISLSFAYGDNQTPTTTSLLPDSDLPFEITITEAGFSLPAGIQTAVYAIYDGKWLALAGRTNGLHNFDDGAPQTNFPVRAQNTVVYVIDPKTNQVFSKSLFDSTAHLTREQIDTLSVTAAEFYQVGETLYMIGGYGVNSATGVPDTKSVLTAINVPGLMRWVQKASKKRSAAENIRQVFHPLLQVTGGVLMQANAHDPFLLAFGQNFQGFYTDESNGSYTQQVRSFQIIDNGYQLYIQPNRQPLPNPNFRRRDLNVVPIIQKQGQSYGQAFVGLAGVFTLTGGAWTVPVQIGANGSTFMADPSDPNIFKQGVNIYNSAYLGLFSKNTHDMYTVLLGGIGDGVDPELPFVNIVTAVRIDAHGNFSQYLMNATYPTIIGGYGDSPDTPLLFGVGARFIPLDNRPLFPNGVFSLDELGSSPIVLGHIIGGIESTVPNTNIPSTETRATARIFQVTLQKR